MLEGGEFEAEVYYACSGKDVGATVELSLGGSRVKGKISEAQDPPVLGAENDRTPRMDSYVKDFKPLKLGRLRLDRGKGTLTLRALEKPGAQVMEFRLLTLTRLTGKK